METVETQAVDTPTTEKTAVEKVDTSSTQKNDGFNKEETSSVPYKIFASKDDFDKHSAGILNSAKVKAEKELLAMLGLKLDEKDKLAKFKQAYDASLSESEKQAQALESLSRQVETLENQIAEKDAVILTLGKFANKDLNDVSKYVKMAKGLIDDNTSIEQALSQVFDFVELNKKVPRGKPLNEPSGVKVEKNPFETENYTEQGNLIRSDREKAREMYMAVHGRLPSW